MTHIDELISKLGNIMERVAALRISMTEGKPGQKEVEAADTDFDAMKNEVLELTQASPNPWVRSCGVSRFQTLGKWPTIELRPEYGLTYSSTSSIYAAPKAERQFKVGEMCAKLDEQIREFMRDDLKDALAVKDRPHRPKGTGYHDADATLIAEMRDLIEQKVVPSVTQAAHRVAAHAQGGGSLDSKIRRLVDRYKKTNGE